MYKINKLFLPVVAGLVLLIPSMASAGGLIDSLNLAPFIPTILDAMMQVATGTYSYFVETGIILALIVGFLAMTVCWYAIKLFAPPQFLTLFDIKPGDKLGEVKPQEIAKKILQPGLRAVIALLVLLNLKPMFMTQWLINPFLQLGSIYTTQVLEPINITNKGQPNVVCPKSIIEQLWLT